MRRARETNYGTRGSKLDHESATNWRTEQTVQRGSGGWYAKMCTEGKAEPVDTYGMRGS